MRRTLVGRGGEGPACSYPASEFRLGAEKEKEKVREDNTRDEQKKKKRISYGPPE